MREPSSLGDLSGRTALVTGGGAGLGRAIAKVLADQGARVLVTDLSGAAASETAAIIGGAAASVALDVRSNPSVQGAFEWVGSNWGQLDILVNNAGVVTAMPGNEGAPDTDRDWDVILDINLRGTVRCSEHAAELMKARRSGKIISIASMAGHAARRVGGAYGVSKAAVLRYTRGLAVELGPYGINVNAVCPGAVWTPLQERGTARRQARDPALSGRDPHEVFVAVYAPITLLGRPQDADDVGKAVAFLASDDARNITGQCLHVDGGAILRD